MADLLSNPSVLLLVFNYALAAETYFYWLFTPGADNLKRMVKAAESNVGIYAAMAFLFLWLPVLVAFPFNGTLSFSGEEALYTLLIGGGIALFLVGVSVMICAMLAKSGSVVYAAITLFALVQDLAIVYSNPVISILSAFWIVLAVTVALTLSHVLGPFLTQIARRNVEESEAALAERTSSTRQRETLGGFAIQGAVFALMMGLRYVVFGLV